MYLWNATNGSIDTLCTHNEEGSYVSSLSWAQNGKHLAIGTGNNKVQLWDVETKRKDRTLFSAGTVGGDSRVAAIGWSPTGQLSSGSRAGAIWHHDPRAQRHHVSTMVGHTQEVCGLKWSPDGKYLASGGNDNLVNIFQADGTNVHKFTEHQAAVKAMAWCPWQSNVLATGGGTACKSIKFWNTGRGTCALA